MRLRCGSQVIAMKRTTLCLLSKGKAAQEFRQPTVQSQFDDQGGCLHRVTRGTKAGLQLERLFAPALCPFWE